MKEISQIIVKKSRFYSESAVWYWKSKMGAAKAIFHCARLKGSFVEDFSLYYVAWLWLAGHITGNWLLKLLHDWELTSLPLFTFFWIDIF